MSLPPPGVHCGPPDPGGPSRSLDEAVDTCAGCFQEEQASGASLSPQTART